MSQSLARLYVHLVFSTKHREPIISDRVRNSLHSCMGGVLRNLRCRPLLINSVDDHVHVLFDLARTIPISRAVQEIKTASTRWIKTQGEEFEGFAWQAGYSAFSVSESKAESVRYYIAKQKDHHRVESFQEEYLALLEKHGVAYDMQNVWD